MDGARGGVQGQDEPVPSVEGAPPPPPPAPSPAPAPATSGGGGWKDRLKQAAQQGKELAEKGKAELAKQQEQRAAAAANDPDTLWIGEKKSAGTSAIVSTTRYRITKDKIFVEAGLMSSLSEQVPLWAVRDIDVRQKQMLTQTQYLHHGGAGLRHAPAGAATRASGGSGAGCGCRRPTPQAGGASRPGHPHRRGVHPAEATVARAVTGPSREFPSCAGQARCAAGS